MKAVKDIFDNSVTLFQFGNFKGMDYGDCDESFDEYRTYQNKITKEKIIQHIENLEPYCCMPMPNHEIFTGEAFKVSPGYYRDGDFIFPLDFLYYLKNYDIGIPHEYEKYLMSVQQELKALGRL